MPDAPTDVATQPKADSAFAGTVIIVTNAGGVQRLATTDAPSDIISAGKLSWIDIVGADAAVQCALLQKPRTSLLRAVLAAAVRAGRPPVRGSTHDPGGHVAGGAPRRVDGSPPLRCRWIDPDPVVRQSRHARPDAQPLRGTGQRARAQSPQGGGHRAPASARDAAAGGQRHR